ncbi:MAG: hypothetical protein H6573_05275 [Lewinellaceae bacterium]|nr:hypothetical protein [Phaeodactylibacter sp.]MCB0612520.1 hypothetical protein [Phaeodactylibacter sp.]MCB9346912.1 hypothetical protein [Lewinellaceae bacterium]
MERELLFEEDGYQMYKEYAMDEEFFKIMEHASLGTKQTLYHHYYSREHLSHIPGPYFFTVRRDGRLQAAVTFCRRTIKSRGQENQGLYIRYFAAAPEMKGKGLVGRFSKLVMQWAIEHEERQAAFYAAIEARNARVKKVVHSVGFSELATIKTVGFSRFFPRANPAVRPLSKDEFTAFLPRLEAMYSDYAFWMTDNLCINQGYFVLEEGGQAIAGVQAHRAHWAIEKLPGLIGALLPALPYIPLLNRIFNPRDFRFLTFEGFFVVPGYENRLQGLLEGLLARYGYHSAIFWFDERDPFYPRLLKHNRMGLLHRFVGDSEARFIVNLKGFSATEAANLTEAPLYISGHDNI